MHAGLRMRTNTHVDASNSMVQFGVSNYETVNGDIDQERLQDAL